MVAKVNELLKRTFLSWAIFNLETKLRRMSKYYIPSLLLTVLSSLALNAQSHFLPGKIVSNAGDTVSGQIDYGNWMVNPRTIRFRSGPGAKLTSCAVADLRYFEVNGRDKYERGIVQKDMRPLAMVGFSSSTDTARQPNVRDTAFLRVLVKGGRLSLYELVDSKAHYYISDRSGTYNELVFALVLSQDNSRVDELDQFRVQLKEYLTDADGHDLERKIDRAAYNEDDLRKIVLVLDGYKKGSTIVEEVSHRRSMVARFYACVGAGYGKLTLPGSVGNEALSPGINGGMELIRTRNNGDLAIRLEVGYFSASYKGHGTDPYYENYAYAVKASTISPSVSIIYYFYRGDQFRLYAGAGVVFNLSSYPGGVYSLYQAGIPTPQDSKLSPQPFWDQLQLKIGAQISNRFSVEILGGPQAGINPNLQYFSSASISQFALKVGYYFNGTH
jgi:hypothetical protein